MPAEARPRVRKLPSGKWQLRYKDAAGGYRSGGAHDSKTAAFNHYNENIRPELEGRPQPRRDVTLQELADTFLDRHASVAKPARSGRCAVGCHGRWTSSGTWSCRSSRG